MAHSLMFGTVALIVERPARNGELEYWQEENNGKKNEMVLR
jgi:hypothetical protein